MSRIFSFPSAWINTEIRKNVRKLQRLYKQKKKTGDQNTKEKYNQLKHHTQKITRQSYWKYIENIVLGERLSGPCALYGLRFFSSFVIPFVVILNGFIV
jgi:hypothetical protein